MLKFGTSGVRGLVVEFTHKEICLFIWAFLTHAKNVGQLTNIAIAMDLRESSPTLKNSAIEAIQIFTRGISCNIFDCDTLPTPALAYFAQEKKCLGIVITGSHIPADRNGLKFYLQSGETLKSDDHAIFNIYENLKTNPPSFREIHTGHIDNASTDARKLYLDRYLNYFPPHTLTGYKFIFYQHSSVARELFPEILRALGADVLLRGRSDIFIPVDTEAVQAVDQFKIWIKEAGAHGLITTDGDADRPLFIDQLGAILPGDKLGALTAIYLELDAIAMPISCNSGILSCPSFKKVVTTKIGSPYVVNALNQLATEFSLIGGFEANGGFILQSDIHKKGRFLKKLPTRDAVLPVICTLALAKQISVSTSKVTNLLAGKHTSSGLIRNYANEKSQALIESVSEDPSEYFRQILPEWKLTLSSVNNQDGLRCQFIENLIIHLRPSGNAPEFRCYIEADEVKVANALCQDILTALSK